MMLMPRQIVRKLQKALHSEASPVVKSLTVAGAVIFLAVEIGAAELTLGAFVGYSAYRMFRYGVPLKDIVREVF